MKTLKGVFKDERTWFWVLAAIVVAHRMTLMTRGLWIDEFQSYYVICGSFEDVFARAVDRFHQSPLFYVLSWLFSRVAGFSEFALRLPSFLYAVLAAYYLYRLAAEVFNKEAARFAALIFLSAENIAFAEVSVRPYSLGLLFATMSFHYLIQWTRNGGARNRLLHIICSALVFHAQLIFSLFILLHVVYFLLEPDRNRSVSWKTFLVSLVWIGAAALPLFPLLAALWGDRGKLSFLDPPGRTEFERVVFGAVPWFSLAVLSIAGAFLAFDRYLRNGDRNLKRLFLSSAVLAGYATPLFFPAFLIHFLERWAHLRRELSKRVSFSQLGTDAIFILPLAPVVFYWSVHPEYLPLYLNLFLNQSVVQGRAFFVTHQEWAFGAACLFFYAIYRLFGDELSPIRRNHVFTAIVWYFLPPLLFFMIATFTAAHVFLFRYFIYGVVGWSLLAGVAVYALKRRWLKWGVFIWVIYQAVVSVPYPHYYFMDDWRGPIAKANQLNSNGDHTVLYCSGLIESNHPDWLQSPQLGPMFVAATLYYPLRARIINVPRDFNDHHSRDFRLKLFRNIKKRGGKYLILGSSATVSKLTHWMKFNLKPRYRFVARYDFSLNSLVEFEVKRDVRKAGGRS